MKPGKIPPHLLQSLVFSHLPRLRGDVLVRAGLGQDCAAVDFGDHVCVVSTDPITAASASSGWYAVHVACNDIAATGAEPVGVLLTILGPESTKEEDIEGCVVEAARAAQELGIEILGGHTEITPGIPSLIISASALGKAPKDRYLTSTGARPGDDLVLTKAAGLEGTAILATDYYERLRGRIPEDKLRAARELRNCVSVVKDGLIAARNGASAMHDVTEGGVLGAAYEMAAGAGIGVVVWEDAIPVLPETEAICKALGIDYLRLISSGAMCIATKDGGRLIAALARQGINARIIGRFTDPGAPMLLYPAGAGQHGEAPRPIEPPESDELWRIKEVLG